MFTPATLRTSPQRDEAGRPDSPVWGDDRPGGISQRGGVRSRARLARLRDPQDIKSEGRLVVPILVVIGYADQGVAEDARKSVQELEDELTIDADRVASVARDVDGRYHAHISYGAALASGVADWGWFWEALFGLLFSVPTAGVALGAGMGAPRDWLFDCGIDHAFQDKVREQVKPGTSAVFMMIELGNPDKAVSELARYGGTLIKTSLSDAEFERLRKTLRMTFADTTTSAAIETSKRLD